MPGPDEYYSVPFRRLAVGNRDEFRQPGALKAAIAEFISTFIFVFAGSGSSVAYNKVTAHAPSSPDGLIAAALAYGLALFVAVSIAANISGGHVNPAVTFGLFVGGNITLFRGILYIIAQLLGSVVACLLLYFVVGFVEIPALKVSGVSVWSALVFELVMTFGLVYTVYATAVDPKKGQVGIIAPLAIGLIVGANILAGGPFTGASMNPAVAFGPAVLSFYWTHHWVYWVGPLLGGAIAGIVYEIFFITHTPEAEADF